MSLRNWINWWIYLFCIFEWGSDQYICLELEGEAPTCNSFKFLSSTYLTEHCYRTMWKSSKWNLRYWHFGCIYLNGPARLLALLHGTLPILHSRSAAGCNLESQYCCSPPGSVRFFSQYILQLLQLSVLLQWLMTVKKMLLHVDSFPSRV